MNIHEYQAKEIFREHNIPVGSGVVILDDKEIDEIIESFEANLFVIKAQIHAGGRGKAGGVKLTKDKEEAKKIAKKMWGMNLVTPQTGIQGQKVERLYIESGVNIKKQFYLSAILDRSNSCITFIVSLEGGVDIEEIAQKSEDKILKINIDPKMEMEPFYGRKIAFKLGLQGESIKQMVSIVNSIYDICTKMDATQVEINPLALTNDDKLIAVDAKINFDDNGLARQKEVRELRDENEEDQLENRAVNHGLSYVKMDGNIGCMVNGAGLAMATMDIIKLYGAQPANFLDVGGGADKERVSEAFRIILSDKNVKGILVNIFGGIMRCDIIAEGIVTAAKDIGLTIPLVVRLAGTNFELGVKILNDSGLKIISASNLAEAAEKIVNAVK